MTEKQFYMIKDFLGESRDDNFKSIEQFYYKQEIIMEKHVS